MSDSSLIRTDPGHSTKVTSVAFSPDGVTLAAGSDDNTWGGDNTITLWRVSDGGHVRTLTLHRRTVDSVAFSPDGSLLASASADYTVRLWRASDGALVRTLTGHTSEVCSVAFSPDGSILASGSRDNTIRLWRVSDGTRIHTFTGHTGGVYSVAFSPDGTTLASGDSDATIRLWRVSDGSLVRALTGHSSAVQSVAFSPDGSTLASGSSDNMLRLWRPADGSLAASYDQETFDIRSIAFSADASLLAYGRFDATVVVARNPYQPSPMRLPSAKPMKDDTYVRIMNSSVVTSVWTGLFYIEDPDRTSGIAVKWPYTQWIDAGTIVEVGGRVRTDSNGERYIEADYAHTDAAASVDPLDMNNRNLGGADFHYDPSTGSGQRGVTGGSGLNNIGLLVRTVGVCTRIGDHTFTIDDGSGVTVTCETPATILVNPAWKYVAATGISSMCKVGETYERLLKITGVAPIISEPTEGVTGR